MKKKNLYHSPSIEIIQMKSMCPIQTSSEIPDSGWGAKMRDFDDTPENFTNIKLW
jgi:hypothetical protein